MLAADVPGFTSQEEDEAAKIISRVSGGRPGAGLLLIRVAVGVSALIQGIACLTSGGRPTILAWAAGLLMVACGALFIAGFLTPIVSGLLGLSILGSSLSAAPIVEPSLLDTKTSEILALTMVAAVGLMGPGGFSIDAHLFGRREILIPPVRVRLNLKRSNRPGSTTIVLCGERRRVVSENHQIS